MVLRRVSFTGLAWLRTCQESEEEEDDDEEEASSASLSDLATLIVLRRGPALNMLPAATQNVRWGLLRVMWLINAKWELGFEGLLLQEGSDQPAQRAQSFMVDAISEIRRVFNTPTLGGHRIP